MKLSLFKRQAITKSQSGNIHQEHKPVFTRRHFQPLAAGGALVNLARRRVLDAEEIKHSVDSSNNPSQGDRQPPVNLTGS